MLKILFFVGFVIPVCFMNNFYWMVQNLLFFIMFIFLIFNYFMKYFVNISYFLGCDMISYGLFILSFWICSLMLMASESIYKYNLF